MSGLGGTTKAAVDAVVAALTGIPETSVFDYGLGGREPQRNLLVVGEGIGSVKIDQARLGSRYGLQMFIGCRYITMSGSKQLESRSQVAADLLDEVEQRILADPTLGGVAFYATLGPETTWRAGEPGGEFAEMQVTFSIEVRMDVVI